MVRIVQGVNDPVARMANRCMSGVLAVLLCVTWFYLLLASAWFVCNDPSKGLSGMSHALIKGYFPVLIIYLSLIHI